MVAHLGDMWWLIGGDVVTHRWICNGSLVEMCGGLLL